MYLLKNIKTLRTSDGEAFTATLYRDKTRIGEVANGGYGGPNEIHIKDQVEREAFHAAAVAYNQSLKKPYIYEVDEGFVDRLMALAEYQKAARDNARKGYPHTVVIRRRWEDFGLGNGTGSFREVFTLGYKDPADLPRLLQEHKAEEHEVVTL